MSTLGWLVHRPIAMAVALAATTFVAAQTLPVATPEAFGMSADRLQKLTAVLKQESDNTPGAGARAAILPQSAAATSRVKRFEITRRELFAEGMAFGDVGAYEKLVGVATLELDVGDAHNAAIVDKDRVARNAMGRIEYSTEVYILRPVDPARGNGKLLFEVNNRGNKRILTYVNDSTSTPIALNEPRTAQDAGNGFLMRQGYTMAWAGWQGDVRPVENRLTIKLPVATNLGQEIHGRVAVQYDALQGVSAQLSAAQFEPYEAVSLDTSLARLTSRDRIDGPETTISGDQWAFARCDRDASGGAVTNVMPSSRHVCYFKGFERDKLYQLIFTAKNPLPMALGYAVTRDIVSFLRYDRQDASGGSNPLGASVRNVICMGISSSAMYVRDWMYLGFNEDTAGRKVCDGMMVHIGGAHRLHLATRFTQPDLYSRQDMWAGLYPLSTFPFSFGESTDPLTGRRDAILKRPRTDPYVIQTDTSMEYWQFHASLVTHDALGNELTLPDNVRYYLLSSAQHLAVAGAAPSRGMCEQLSNPLTPGAFLRALVVAMDQWITDATPPPPSEYPRAGNGTLVAPDRASTGFPSIPGVRYGGLVNRLALRDYGPQFTSRGGIITLLPSQAVPGKEYQVLVPKVDADGNDVAGLRRPDELGAPLATYTGWNHRRAGLRSADLCALTGSYIPFARTRTERTSSGDPRASLEERYPSRRNYLDRVTHSSADYAKRRLLLQEDVERIEQAATGRTVP